MLDLKLTANFYWKFQPTMTTILFWNSFCSNRPLPSSKNSRFQNETKCKTFVVKMSIILEVLIEEGSAAVSCDANRTKTVCRTVEHEFFFIKVNNLVLLALWNTQSVIHKMNRSRWQMFRTILLELFLSFRPFKKTANIRSTTISAQNLHESKTKWQVLPKRKTGAAAKFMIRQFLKVFSISSRKSIQNIIIIRDYLQKNVSLSNSLELKKWKNPLL